MAERLFVCASLLNHAIQLMERTQNVKLCSQYNMERANQLAARDGRGRCVNNRDTSGKVHETWAHGLEMRWPPPIPSLIRGHSPTGTRERAIPCAVHAQHHLLPVGAAPNARVRVTHCTKPKDASPADRQYAAGPARVAWNRVHDRARACGQKQTEARSVEIQRPLDNTEQNRPPPFPANQHSTKRWLSTGLRLKSRGNIGAIHFYENKPHNDAGWVGGCPTVLAGRNHSI
jgi:hypothetical protein